ncbi:hypothetical protein QQF64_005035 [Cirrhinus molitorella]|uniref:Uncharacterized protein n=1 Tax=Cirrhinus molitorella TaxID=172907 RepID=A0ABR3MHZ5_9TELE
MHLLEQVNCARTPKSDRQTTRSLRLTAKGAGNHGSPRFQIPKFPSSALHRSMRPSWITGPDFGPKGLWR